MQDKVGFKAYDLYSTNPLIQYRFLIMCSEYYTMINFHMGVYTEPVVPTSLGVPGTHTHTHKKIYRNVALSAGSNK